VIERLRVTLASRLALLLGTVLRDISIFAVPAMIVIAIAIPFGFHAHWGGLALLLLLLAALTASCSASSSAPGIRLKQIGSLAAVVTGLQLPLTLLSGILLPLSLGPGWLRFLGHPQPHVLRGPGRARPGRRDDHHCHGRHRVPRHGRRRGACTVVGYPQLEPGHAVTAASTSRRQAAGVNAALAFGLAADNEDRARRVMHAVLADRAE
jgi:ABC-2 type transporter